MTVAHSLQLSNDLSSSVGGVKGLCEVEVLKLKRMVGLSGLLPRATVRQQRHVLSSESHLYTT